MNSWNLDSVIRASASTYSPYLEQHKVKLAINLSNLKSQHIGEPPNQLYPEIIVWKPSPLNENEGEPLIVESIESEDTLENPNIFQKWQKLEQLKIEFHLVIPEFSLPKVERLLSENKIKPTHLQTYQYIGPVDRFRFTTHQLWH